jgi:hypothetical protein
MARLTNDFCLDVVWPDFGIQDSYTRQKVSNFLVLERPDHNQSKNIRLLPTNIAVSYEKKKGTNFHYNALYLVAPFWIHAFHFLLLCLILFFRSQLLQ